MIQINRHQQKSTEINRHQHINTSFNGLLWLCFDFGYWKPLKTPNLQDLARSLKYAVLCEEVREKDRALPKMIIDANDLSFFFGNLDFLWQSTKIKKHQKHRTKHRTNAQNDIAMIGVWSSESDLPPLEERRISATVFINWTPVYLQVTERTDRFFCRQKHWKQLRWQVRVLPAAMSSVLEFKDFQNTFFKPLFHRVDHSFLNFNISIFNIYNFTYFFRPPNLHVSSFLQDLGRHSVVHFHRVCHTIYDLLRPMSQCPEDRKDSTDTTDIWQIDSPVIRFFSKHS